MNHYRIHYERSSVHDVTADYWELEHDSRASSNDWFHFYIRRDDGSTPIVMAARANTVRSIQLLNASEPKEESAKESQQ